MMTETMNSSYKKVNKDFKSKTHQGSRGLRIGLWTAQSLLAAMFLMAGSMKLMMPVEMLAKNLPWVSSVSPILVKFIGLSEFAGAIGLILPSLTRILPILTPFAASGLATIMVLASGFHLMRGESAAIGMNVILAAIAVFIAWGRLNKAPIEGR